ncbi:MAG: class I SAM-dependent methyltransferase [Bacteroidetes bacterium]|nr:class I SAM-dependent methyltransferase [Bacteroidota bacterium]
MKKQIIYIVLISYFIFSCNNMSNNMIYKRKIETKNNYKYKRGKLIKCLFLGCLCYGATMISYANSALKNISDNKFESLDNDYNIYSQSDYIEEVLSKYNNTIIKDRSDLHQVINNFKFKVGCEIGTWKGYFADAILQNWNGTLYMIDPYMHLDDWNMAFNKDNNTMNSIFNETKIFMKNKFGDRALFIRKNSIYAYNLFEDNYFDWLFIDGDHSFKGIFADLVNYYSKAKYLICGHDYLNMKQGGYDDFEVKKVVDGFARAKNLTIYNYGDKVWCFAK